MPDPLLLLRLPAAQTPSSSPQPACTAQPSQTCLFVYVSVSQRDNFRAQGREAAVDQASCAMLKRCDEQSNIPVICKWPKQDEEVVICIGCCLKAAYSVSTPLTNRKKIQVTICKLHPPCFQAPSLLSEYGIPLLKNFFHLSGSCIAYGGDGKWTSPKSILIPGHASFSARINKRDKCISK